MSCFVLGDRLELCQVVLVEIHDRPELVLRCIKDDLVEGFVDIFFHVFGVDEGIFDFGFENFDVLACSIVLAFKFLNYPVFVFVDELVELGIILFDFFHLLLKFDLGFFHFRIDFVFPSSQTADRLFQTFEELTDFLHSGIGLSRAFAYSHC